MKKTKIILSILFMCFVFAGTFNTAKAAVVSNDIIMNPSEDNTQLYIDKEGYVCNYQYDDIDSIVTKYIYKEDKAYPEFTVSTKVSEPCVMTNEQDNTTIIANEYIKKGKVSGKIKFSVYSPNGKLKKVFVDKFMKKDGKIDGLGVINMTCKGNKLYYLFHKDDGKSGYYIKCINMKSGKMTKQKKIKVNQYSQIIGNKIYFYNKHTTSTTAKVIVYSLEGKKIGTYKVPKKEAYVRSDIYVKGNKLYYIYQSKIYVCTMKKNYKWKIYYDGSADSNFTDYVFCDFCVADNDTFYVSFTKDKDLYIPTKLVKYSK